MHSSIDCMKRGMIHAMVSLQGLHFSDAFRHPNISTSVGLKSFYPWCIKLDGKRIKITKADKLSELVTGCGRDAK